MSDPLVAIRSALIGRVAGWAGMDLAEIRADFSAFLTAVGPTGFAMANARAETLEAVSGVWLGDSDAPPALYLHGGGFQIGGVDSHTGLVARLAEATGLRLFLVEYRLAPEHRYPAAIEDACFVYRTLVARGETPVAILGDSAGGALALLCAMHARDNGLPAPRALILLSPWLDLSLSGESYSRLAAVDPFSKPAQLRAMARSYLGRNGPILVDPAVSPLFGDLKGLPPVLIHAGESDITLDDARTLKARGEELVTLMVYSGMCHHFQVFEPLPQAAESLAAIGTWWHALSVSRAEATPVRPRHRIP